MMHKIAAWNIRECNDISKQVEISKFINDHNVNMVAILENKLNVETVKKACQTIQVTLVKSPLEEF